MSTKLCQILFLKTKCYKCEGSYVRTYTCVRGHRPTVYKRQSSQTSFIEQVDVLVIWP